MIFNILKTTIYKKSTYIIVRSAKWTNVGHKMLLACKILSQSKFIEVIELIHLISLYILSEF